MQKCFFTLSLRHCLRRNSKTNNFIKTLRIYKLDVKKPLGAVLQALNLAEEKE